MAVGYAKPSTSSDLNSTYMVSWKIMITFPDSSVNKYVLTFFLAKADDSGIWLEFSG